MSFASTWRSVEKTLKIGRDDAEQRDQDSSRAGQWGANTEASKEQAKRTKDELDEALGD